MSEARNIELKPVVDVAGQPDVVLISANDPDAMLRHTQECRQRGYDFAADPSQQLARMDGPAIKPLIEGAKYLFTNEYEGSLIEQKTGWTSRDIAAMVETRVTTLGKNGARVERRGHEPVLVNIAQENSRTDPTGVGDAFRSGFLTGMAWGVSDERAAQLGSLLAAYVIESVGTQEYVLSRAAFLNRLARNFGDDAAGDIAPHVVCPQP